MEKVIYVMMQINLALRDRQSPLKHLASQSLTETWVDAQTNIPAAGQFLETIPR
jgi:hypothetical protein